MAVNVVAARAERDALFVALEVRVAVRDTVAVRADTPVRAVVVAVRAAVVPVAVVAVRGNTVPVLRGDTAVRVVVPVAVDAWGRVTAVVRPRDDVADAVCAFCELVVDVEFVFARDDAVTPRFDATDAPVRRVAARTTSSESVALALPSAPIPRHSAKNSLIPFILYVVMLANL